MGATRSAGTPSLELSRSARSRTDGQSLIYPMLKTSHGHRFLSAATGSFVSRSRPAGGTRDGQDSARTCFSICARYVCSSFAVKSEADTAVPLDWALSFVNTLFDCAIFTSLR